MPEFSRYERQWILREIGREGQHKLDQSRVAVVGLGALGSVASNLLARAGIGQLLVIDRDDLEISNLQRQVLFDEQDVKENLPKAIAAKRKLEQVNSEIKIEAEVTDLNPQTIDPLLAKVDLVMDGTDNFETRYLINDYALSRGLPWIYGGAVRTEGMSYVILPGQGPCLRCLFGQAPLPGDTQTCDQVGILASVAHMIASFQVTEAIKILAGRLEAVERKMWKLDLWRRQFQSISVDHLKDSPCSGCQSKDYPYLVASSQTRAVRLCGANAVQITRAGEEKIDLGLLASKLSGKGAVVFNDYLLKYQFQPYEITVFASGRAIVKGTEDEGKAKSLYAQCVGV